MDNFPDLLWEPIMVPSFQSLCDLFSHFIELIVVLAFS